MTPSALLALLASNAKLATAAAATAAVTAGGGLAVASAVTVDNSHAAAGLDKVAVAQAPAAADPESADAGTAPDAQAPSTDSVDCPAGVKNHGEFVSSIAKTKPAEGSEPNAHGKAVSAAAKSDCGKKDGDDASTEDPESSDAQDGADDDADTDDDTNDDAGTRGRDNAPTHAPTHPTGKPSSVPPTHGAHG